MRGFNLDIVVNNLDPTDRDELIKTLFRTVFDEDTLRVNRDLDPDLLARIFEDAGVTAALTEEELEARLDLIDIASLAGYSVSDYGDGKPAFSGLSEKL